MHLFPGGAVPLVFRELPAWPGLAEVSPFTEEGEEEQQSPLLQPGKLWKLQVQMCVSLSIPS